MSISYFQCTETELFEIPYEKNIKRFVKTFKPSSVLSDVDTQPINAETVIETIKDEPPSLRRQNAFLAATQLLKTKPASHLTRLKNLFKPLLQASYKTIDEAAQTAQRFNLTLNRVYSTENTHVYIDNVTGYPLIVHRGSKTASDFLIEDSMILTGLNRLLSSPRMIKAQELTKEVERYYNKPADAFGHSLGSVISENSGANGIIMSYNKGSGFGDIKRTVKNDKLIEYRNKRDLVSLISETQSRNNNIRYIGSGDEGLIEAHGLDILPTVVNRRV